MSSFCQILNPKQKALEINLNDRFYGTFAEIGAGQEVARYFFKAGGAAGTIAKSISAYDMTVSDVIYGKCKSGRYVSEERLAQMLEREYGQLVERLKDVRHPNTCFFAFADTVAAKSFKYKNEAHGWLGVKFMHEPGARPSEVILHVRMLDRDNAQQQEALGILGVNLVHACFHHTHTHEVFVNALMEGLTTERIEIDMIRSLGEAFKVDSRILSLELVKRKYCRVVYFDEEGTVHLASDKLYKKNILVSRGSFRPPTLVNIDMLDTGLEKLKTSLKAAGEDPEQSVALAEVSMSKLVERGLVDNDDFLARVKLLACLKRPVLLSSFENSYELNEYLTRVGKKQVAFVLGVYNVEQILEESRYQDHAGGMLGGLGALFGNNTHVYVYPAANEDVEGEMRDLQTLKFEAGLTPLIEYLKVSGKLTAIENANPALASIWSRIVLDQIQNNISGWESMVPPEVATIVKKQNLFADKKA